MSTPLSRSLSRRRLLQAAAGTAVFAGAPAVHAAPRDRQYRTALIGTGWWGMNILREALAAGNVQVVGLCDVDRDKLTLAAEEVESLSGDKPAVSTDFRELLDQQSIDIAIVATPDHWHALNGLAALEAGTHLFIEKPTGHTIQESRALLNAARAADRVVQVGLHRRIGEHYRSGMEFLRDGGAGKIGMVKAFVYSQGGPEVPTRNSEPPEQLDWDMYCGPAPLRPFNRKIHPGGFRHFLDFANGTLGDWGVHWLDQILWWTDETAPQAVYSTAGRPIRGEPVLNEQVQTTDTPGCQVALYEFESFTASWEHRRFAGSGAEKSSVGCHFYGTKGTFHMGWRDGWTFYPANDRKPVIHQDATHQEPDGHDIALLWRDFTAAIEAGKRPACDIAIGHAATNMSLLGMLSWKLGRKIRWDADRERVVEDAAANQLLRREYRGDWQYPSV